MGSGAPHLVIRLKEPKKPNSAIEAATLAKPREVRFAPIAIFQTTQAASPKQTFATRPLWAPRGMTERSNLHRGEGTGRLFSLRFG